MRVATIHVCSFTEHIIKAYKHLTNYKFCDYIAMLL